MDMYEVERNPWLYDRLYRNVFNLTNGGGRGGPPMVPTSFFQKHGGKPHLFPPEAGAPAPAVSNPELAEGDALVVRQVEVHRTDRQPLEPGQWRLALGFKVIERLPLVRGPLETSPFSVDMQKVRLRFPALLPPLNLGAPFPDVYDGARLAAYRARPDTWRTHAGRLLEDRPELAMLLVPVSFAVVASLALALRAGLRGTETARMRGARRKE